MNRRFAAISCCLCAWLVAATGRDCVAAPPNVVMIISDDQCWSDFGFMGHDVIRTPKLDKLAAESAVFPKGYVPTSLCRASLASIITGLYAHQHRICCNDPPEGIDRAKMLLFMRDAPALPRLLASAGYRSLQTGKWWEGHYANGGFTEGMTTRGRHGEAGLAIGRQTMQPIYDFLDRRENRPFFVWYAPMMPHEPHNPPQRLLKKYRAAGRHELLAKYYAMCEWFDETCGQLLDYLDRNKLRDDTLVVFAIDNGWIQDTSGAGKGGGRFAPKSKRSPYDGGLRTPVLLRWPGHTKAGRYDDLVSTIDLAPTILSAAGLRLTAQMSGLNLLDAAAGKGPLARDAVCGEIYEHTAIDMDEPALNLTHRWIRQDDWKLIAPEKGQPELYDVAHDPREEYDLAAKEPIRVAALRERLDQWWQGAAGGRPMGGGRPARHESGQDTCGECPVCHEVPQQLAGETPAPQQRPERAHTHFLMSDASAAVAVGPKLFIVANDEDNVLRVYRRDADGRPVAEKDVSAFLGLPADGEADIEGAARLGDTIYWIAAHEKTGQGDRHRFFATDVKITEQRVTIEPIGTAYRDLLTGMLGDEQLAKYDLKEASQNKPKKKDGLSIEGLAATPAGELLIGFRNPVRKGRALLVPLANPRQVVQRRERAKFGRAIELDLGGLGVREIVYSPALGRYLILAGRFDGEQDFNLFRWSGKREDKPLKLCEIDDDWNPEAMVVHPDQVKNMLQILSDDGAEIDDGVERKRLPASERRFRSGWLQWNGE